MRKLSLKEKKRKCAKCGSSPADDPTVRLHRFPQPNNANKSRCELWAKFCFPEEQWKSPKFQNRLFTEHKMLCDRHFKSTSFGHEKRLAKFSIPDNVKKDSSEPDTVVIKSEPKSDPLDQENSDLVEKATVETRRQKIKRLSQQSADRGKATQESPQTKQASKQKTQHVSPAKKKIAQKETRLAINTDKLVKQIYVTNDISTQNVAQHSFDECFNQTPDKMSMFSDCELYGKLLTKKLKTYEVYERTQLMFKIDGLLVEHPPGFENSFQSYTIESTDKILEKNANNTKASTITEANLEYSDDEFSYYRDNDPSSSPQPKKKMKKEPKSSQVSSTSIFSPSPNKPTATTPVEVEQSVNIKRKIRNLPVIVETIVPKDLAKGNRKTPNQVVKVTSSVPNERVKITSIISQPFKIINNPKQPIKFTSNPYKPVTVTSSMSNKPVKVTSSIPNKPVKVISVSNHASEVSVPSHMPLEITIPKNKLVSYTPGKCVQSISQPKGKIMILKSKSSKYVPSSQPPILITVPKLPIVSHSPCDMNSLEQLSSIAVSHASKYQTNNSGENVTEDEMNVVSHEVIYEDKSTKNIMETALKFANIEEELSNIGC